MPTTQYYDFVMEGTNAGHFEISDDGAEIHMNAVFMNGGRRYENAFGLRYAGKRVLAYRSGADEWSDCSSLPEDHYPTSAYPILLRHKIKSYVPIVESSGQLLARTTLKDTGGAVVETRDGAVVRSFAVKDGVVVRINWGGPISTLKDSLTAALAGSPFESAPANPARGADAGNPYPYSTHLNVKFPPLSVVDVPALVAACTDRWYNQTLCRVNDSVVRLGVMQGEYHWHKHDQDDEFFFVLEGQFIIDLEGKSITLQAREGYVVPRGVVHRTRAPERAVILMVETAAIVPTGDA